MLEVPLVFSIPFQLLEGGRRLSKLTKVIGETYLQCWLDWKESRIKTTFKLIETTKTNGKKTDIFTRTPQKRGIQLLSLRFHPRHLTHFYQYFQRYFAVSFWWFSPVVPK
uniref:Uncharacterized protein n=1 Tax=Cacopsylla melanoneura TaxID=428564 RepID=A0A8D9FA43_9HEMI